MKIKIELDHEIVLDFLKAHVNYTQTDSMQSLHELATIAMKLGEEVVGSSFIELSKFLSEEEREELDNKWVDDAIEKSRN